MYFAVYFAILASRALSSPCMADSTSSVRARSRFAHTGRPPAEAKRFMVPKSGPHTGWPKKPSSRSRVQALRQREDLLFRGGFLQGGDLLLQGVEPGEEFGKPLKEACVGGVEADGDAVIERVFLKAGGELKLFHGRYLQNY